MTADKTRTSKGWVIFFFCNKQVIYVAKVAKRTRHNHFPSLQLAYSIFSVEKRRRENCIINGKFNTHCFFLDKLTEEEITCLVDTITLRDQNQNVSSIPYGNLNGAENQCLWSVHPSSYPVVSVVDTTIGSFNKPQRRRQRERHQTKGLIGRTMVLHVRFES